MQSIPRYEHENNPNEIFIDSYNGEDFYFAWGIIDKIIVRHGNERSSYTFWTFNKIELLREKNPANVVDKIIPDFIWNEAKVLSSNVYRGKN